MQTKNVLIAFTVQFVWCGILSILTQTNINLVLHASEPALQTVTPQPFLGPIYYGQEDVWQVFDHQFPNPHDNNDYVIHHDGSRHDPVTITPSPGPTLTPNLTVTPTSAPPYIPNGYGYTGHRGIDYSLKYVPVLATASGEIAGAGWSNPANHRLGYGLHVRMSHPNNNGYETWYGHLSTLTVTTGDSITIDLENPNDRSRILGISGNTGFVFNMSGTCGPITGGSGSLTCGNHLHFEVRENDIVVNPYGWIGTTTPDPWATRPSGAVSYNLWATRPALISTADQYPGAGDTGLPEPVVDQISLLIDDGSPDFSTEGDCFTDSTGSQSYNNQYHYAPVDGEESCWAQWLIEPDAFSPPGYYDLYAHIPDHNNASLDAVYTIAHHGQTSQAHVVQMAYPNPEHSAWAYLGRYQFAMNSTTTEYVRLDDDMPGFEDPANANRIVLADAIRLVPAQTWQLPAQTLYFSWAEAVIMAGVTYNNEDIVAYDPAAGTWSLYFDGSDVGLADVNVDAFALLANGDILLSVDEPVEDLNGLDKADDADVIRFIPTSLGQNTAGSFTLYLSAATFGLEDPINGLDRDIDAISFIPGGELLISTTNDVADLFVGYFADEDLVYWDPWLFIPNWMPYFDGSDVGLSDNSEDVNGAWIDLDMGGIYLTTTGNFAVTSVAGTAGDIFVCLPMSTGATTSCDFISSLFWNGSAHGVIRANGSGEAALDGFALNIPGCADTLNGGFERRLACWTSLTNEPEEMDWLLSINTHTGYYSVEAFSLFSSTYLQATLTSDLLAVTGGMDYCFSLYGKDTGDTETAHLEVIVRWYDHTQSLLRADLLLNLFSDALSSNWQIFTSFTDAPGEAVQASILLAFSTLTLTTEQDFSHSLFLDDLSFALCASTH